MKLYKEFEGTTDISAKSNVINKINTWIKKNKPKSYCLSKVIPPSSNTIDDDTKIILAVNNK